MLLWCPQNSCKVSAILETCEGTIDIPPKDDDAICSTFIIINVIWEETKNTIISRTLSEPNNSIERIYDEEYRKMLTLNADSLLMIFQYWIHLEIYTL